MANRPSSHYPDIGVLGEELVAQWLRATGWVILHRRWRCRWGEIDIIARQEPQEKSSPITPHSSHLLVFVEVKTRSRGNWDAGGLLSITLQKQAKLWQTARCFLATYPNLADYPCQFDVALVRYQRLSIRQNQSAKVLVTLEASPGSACNTFQLGQAVSLAGHQLILQEYISSAFDLS